MLLTTGWQAQELVALRLDVGPVLNYAAFLLISEVELVLEALVAWQSFLEVALLVEGHGQVNL